MVACIWMARSAQSGGLQVTKWLGSADNLWAVRPLECDHCPNDLWKGPCQQYVSLGPLAANLNLKPEVMGSCKCQAAGLCTVYGHWGRASVGCFQFWFVSVPFKLFSSVPVSVCQSQPVCQCLDLKQKGERIRNKLNIESISYWIKFESRPGWFKLRNLKIKPVRNYAMWRLFSYHLHCACRIIFGSW